MASKYSLTTKIIEPQFEPDDIIYLFFSYNENNEYCAGPIFENINIHVMKMNNIFNDVSEIIKKNTKSMCDNCIICVKSIVKQFLKDFDDIELPEKYDELISLFYDK